MNRQVIKHVGAFWVMLTAACGGGHDTDTGNGERGPLSETSSAVTSAPPTAGVPTVKNLNNATQADLMFADALATCSVTYDDKNMGKAINDARTIEIRAKMRSAARGLSVSWCGASCGRPRLYPQPISLDPERSWIGLRANPARNMNPFSGVDVSVPLNKAFSLYYYVPQFAGLDATDAEKTGMQNGLDVAWVNVCVARVMSEQMLLGNTLVMSSSDQRSVLETIRERSQISMLQFADIFTALTLPSPGAGVVVDPSAAALRNWVAENAPGKWFSVGPKAALARWNDDFADAVRLQVESTDALSKLLARSASARHVLPGASASPARDDWAAGGWRQRLLALLHGGDPLGTDGPGYAGCPTSLCRWPDAKQVAGVAAANWSASAARALQLVRQSDAFELVIQPQSVKNEYTGPQDIDINASAKWMYAKLEAAERQAACEVVLDPDTGECASVDANEIPVPALSVSDASKGYRVHARYDLLPSDVQTLVKGLKQMMYSTAAAGSFHLAGNAVARTNSNGAKVLKVDASAVIVSQTQEEVAAKFSKFGWHRLPATIAGGPEVAPFYTGYALNGNSASAAVKSQVLEGARLLGAMPALATVREAVQRAPAGQVTRGASIVSTINAAIGASQVCLRPEEQAVPGSIQTVEHAKAGTMNRQRAHWWKVRVARDTSDPFWSGSMSSYSLIAARNSPWILELLAGQGFEKSGFASRNVSLYQTFGNAFVERTFQAEDPLGWTARVPMADGASEVLFVRRRNTATGDSYRMLSGELSPQIAQGLDATDELKHEPPFDGQCVAVGGRFGGYGSRVLSVNSADPSKPAMDGFEIVGGKQSIPSLSEQITRNEFNNSASLSDYVAQWMSIASSSSAEATSLVRESVDNLAANLTAQVDVRLARKQAFNEASVAVQELCGVELPDTGGGSLEQYDVSAVEKTCNLEFVTIKAAGSSEAELRALCGNNYVAPPEGSPVQFAWQTGAACEELEEKAPTPREGSDAADGGNCSGADLPSKEVQKCTQKQCEAETQVTKPPSVEAQVKCTLDSLATQLKRTVLVAKPVACYQYSSSIPSSMGGALAGGMQTQLNALRTYRDSLAAFVASGQAALTQGKVADEAFKASVAEYCVTQAAVAVAMHEERDKLAELHRQWAAAIQTLVQAAEHAVKLGATDAEQRKAMLLGVTQGAMAGAALGPGGAVVGGLIGGAAAVLGSGPSEQEKRAARQAVERAMLAEEQARVRVEEYTAFLGECDEEAGDDPEFGECEHPRPSDTLMGLGQRRDAAAWQATQLARAQGLFAVHDGIAQLRRNVAEVGAAAGTVIAASFGLRQAAHETALAISVGRMEAELVAERTDAQFAIFQAFHANDMWTAHANVEAARHALVTARKAVEFAYGIDMSELVKDYGAVKSPSLWVDRIYDYDLTPLPVVFGSGPPPSPDTIDTRKVASYEDNLAAFIQSYATAENVVFEHQKNQRMQLAGPAAGSLGTSRRPFAWSFLCPVGSACAPQGGWCSPTSDIMSVCAPSEPQAVAPKPLGAKLTFMLDPWGNQDIGLPRPNLTNGRWHRLRVNIVTEGGVGVDCDESGLSDVEVEECKPSDTRILYSMRALGQFSVINANQAESLLGLAPTELAWESAVDTGNPTTHDPVMPTWEAEALFSSALFGYPLAGMYEIKLFPHEYQDVRNVQGVDIVADETFWRSTVYR